MRSPTITFLASLSVLGLLSTAALADDADPPPQPPNRPQYPAPLSQTTQSTYVPQSVALSGPEEIRDFDASRPIPDGYTLVRRTRKGPIIGGAVTFGVSYGISLLTYAIGEDASDCSNDGGNCDNEVAAMAIPVAGPFIQMTSTESATAKFFLGGLGVAQVTGAALLYYGLTSKRAVLVRNDLVGNLQVTPIVGAKSSGIALSGRF